MASISNIKARKIKNNRTFYEHRHIHQSHPLFPPVWGGDHKITYKQFQKEKKKSAGIVLMLLQLSKSWSK